VRECVRELRSTPLRATNVNLPERRRSALETNISRSGIWDTGGRSEGEALHGTDLLGVVGRSEGSDLGPLEMDVFSWLTSRWFEQRAPSDGIVRCTLYELGRDMYGRKPSGKEVRLLRQAIENLAGALVSLGGFNAHTGESKPKLVSLVHLVESAVWAENLDVAVPTRANAAQTGALRGNSYEIKLGSWLIPQLHKRYVTYLDWRVQRKLDGLAKRLWVYLEAERYKPVGGGREATYIILGEKAYTALGVRHGRDRDRRLALKRAGERIVQVDDHYVSVVVETNPMNRKTFRVLAERVQGAERRNARRAIQESLASVAVIDGVATEGR
jgi:hypothetical protein